VKAVSPNRAGQKSPRKPPRLGKLLPPGQHGGPAAAPAEQSLATRQRIASALKCLRSLHDGDHGVLEAIGIGLVIVPDLAKLLFAREPCGLFQPRSRAVEALAALRAFDVLASFLQSLRRADDPVERLGDDVVASAAGRAIAQLREAWVSDLLIEFARHRPLQGVLVGLGSFLRLDALPLFIGALAEDELRLTAQASLRRYGAVARSDLVATALESPFPPGKESESHLRKRRAALSVLIDLSITSKFRDRLRGIIRDPDPVIAHLAREVCAASGRKRD